MSNVEIIFVGTGDASNSGARAQQAIWIKTAKVNILVDCGHNTLLQVRKLGLDLKQLDAVLFTHFHSDHMGGLASLDLTMMFEFRRKRKIVYGGPKGLTKKIPQLLNMAYSSLYPNDHFPRNIEEYAPAKDYSILGGKVKFSTLKMVHAKESIAYKMQINKKTIAITGDTQWNDNLIPLAKNSDLFICECYHYDRPKLVIGHNSYQDLRENKSLLETKQIALVHSSGELLANRQKVRMKLPKDGASIIL